LGKDLALIASINFYPPFDRLLRYVIPKKFLQRMLDHKAIATEKVHERLSFTEQRPDFVNTITTQNEGRGEKAITMKEIKLNMSILVFAGSETTASALPGITRMLLQNRTAMATLNEEVRASFKAESETTIATVGHLKYLGTVIVERHTTLSAFVTYRHPHPVKVEVSHVP
jgi:cytochrome P450